MIDRLYSSDIWSCRRMWCSWWRTITTGWTVCYASWQNRAHVAATDREPAVSYHRPVLCCALFQIVCLKYVVKYTHVLLYLKYIPIAGVEQAVGQGRRMPLQISMQGGENRSLTSNFSMASLPMAQMKFGETNVSVCWSTQCLQIIVAL